MATEDAMWHGDHNRPRIKTEDFIKITTCLRPFYPLGLTFMYKNWVYGLADRIIERVSKELYGSFLQNRIFSPLGLERTFA
jgi:CubicO group peptidase (beta-lactamase class C family)